MLFCFQLNCSRHQYDNDKYDIDRMVYRIGELNEIFKDPHIMVDESQIYIWDKFLCKIKIYSKKSLRKLAVFGRKGSGPGEFNIINSAGLTDDYIYINAFPKVSCFSKNGKMIKETRGNTISGSFIPIGKNFIGRRDIFFGPQNKKNKILYQLFDSNLRKIKDIFETEYKKEVVEVENSRMQVLWFKDCYNGVVYKDRFYVGSTSRGFFFAVFDSDGNKLYEIKKEYQRVKVTSEFKESLFNRIRRSNAEGLKKFIVKREIVFPKYFPAYINFAVGNGRLYVFKYPKYKSTILEVLILDLKGNLISTSTLPANFWRGIEINKLYFYNGRLYFLEMSEDGETAEIYEVTLS